MPYGTVILSFYHRNRARNKKGSLNRRGTRSKVNNSVYATACACARNVAGKEYCYYYYYNINGRIALHRARTVLLGDADGLARIVHEYNYYLGIIVYRRQYK